MAESQLLIQRRTEMQKAITEATALRAKMEKETEGGKKEYEGLSADREEFIKRTDAGFKLREEVDMLVKAEKLEAQGSETEPPPKRRKRGRRAEKSVGQFVIESDEFKLAEKTKNLDRVSVKMISELNGAAGGFLVVPDRDTRIRELPQRETTILDTIQIIPTSSNLVEIVVQKTRPENVKVVPEGELKPESNMTFDEMNIPIVVIAHWVQVTRQILADAPRLRTTIDVQLREGLRRKFEDMIVAGAGGTDSLVGFLSAAGTQQRTHQVLSNGLGATDDYQLDTLRFAKADLGTKFYRGDVVMVNSITGAKLETEKDGNGNYLKMYDPVTATVWRMRVLENDALPATKAAVMDSRMSLELYVREDIVIYTGQPLDYFLRNKFAILAEMRAGLGVPYPEGICEITWA